MNYGETLNAFRDLLNLDYLLQQQWEPYFEKRKFMPSLFGRSTNKLDLEIFSAPNVITTNVGLMSRQVPSSSHSTLAPDVTPIFTGFAPPSVAQPTRNSVIMSHESNKWPCIQQLEPMNQLTAGLLNQPQYTVDQDDAQDVDVAFGSFPLGTGNAEDENETELENLKVLWTMMLLKFGSRKLSSLILDQNLLPMALDKITKIFVAVERELAMVVDMQQCNNSYVAVPDVTTQQKAEHHPSMLLPAITPEMMEIIENAMKLKNPGDNHNDDDDDNGVLLTSAGITRADLQTLVPGMQLNENVINVYMNLVVERSRCKTDQIFPKVYAFPTCFYTKLLKEGYSKQVRQHLTKKLNNYNIFENDLLFFPIHLGCNHWGLASVDFRCKTISYIDSVGGKSDKTLSILLNYVAQVMKEWQNEILKKQDWVLKNVDDAPREQNENDCGLFMCKIAEYLSRDSKLTFLSENMNYYRQRMVYEIIQKVLLTP